MACRPWCSLCAVLLILLCAAAPAEDVPAALELPGYVGVEEEAQEALLSLAIGDADVSFDATGTWRLGLAVGGGLRWQANAGESAARGVLAPVSVASLPSGFTVYQDPSLTLAVLLEGRYFVEAAISRASSGQATSGLLPAGLGYLTLGYRAVGEELLRRLVVGTRGAEMSRYPFVEVPAMGASSLGVGARLASDNAAQELVLRVDKLPGDSVLFMGMNRLVEKRLEVAAYLDGRVFLLPDAGVLDLSILVEDATGGLLGEDGRRYRPFSIDDGTISAAEGSVSLVAAVPGRLLAWYRDASGREVGDSLLGRSALPATDGTAIDPDAPGVDFSWAGDYLGGPLAERRVTVEGRGYLRLWEQGEFSPFEVPSSYLLEPSENAEAAVIVDTVRRGSDLAADMPDAFGYRLLPAEGRLVATLQEDSRLSMRERFPFPDPARLLYGPQAAAPAGYPDVEIRLRTLEPVAFYGVPGPVVPGSVRVVRNGLEESRFRVDYQSGRVDLLIPAAAGDVVRISYRSSGGAAAPTDLLFAWGNRLALGTSAVAEIAGGLLWSAEPGSFTEAPYQSRGGIVASAGVEGSTRAPAAEDGARARVSIDYDAAVALSLSQPDTTGVRRLFGMEGRGVEVGLAEEQARPAAVPAAATGVPGVVDAAGRGKLVYRDYRQYDALGGGVLLRYDTPDWPPADQVHAYESGSIAGPYEVGGSSADSGGTSLAVDFSMDADEWWVGVQLPAPGGSRLGDLGWVESVVLSLAPHATEGSYEVYLQLGALGEDLDGDAVLDREAGAASAGFSFDDPANGVSLTVGAGPLGLGNGLLDTEDVDGDSFLDPEDPAYTVLLAPGRTGGQASSAGDGEWKLASWSLSAEERARLGRSRAVRVLVVKTAAGPCSGRLLMDRLELLGSAFWAHPAGEGVATVREVRESDLEALRRPAVPLEEAFPDVRTRLHASGSTQEVLEVAWEDLVPPSLLLRGFADTGTGGIGYRELRVFLRAPMLLLSGGAPEAGVELRLVDAAGKGIRVSFTTGPFDEWRELVVDLSGLAATLGGAEPAAVTVRSDEDAADLAELSVAVSGVEAGYLYLDEVRLTSARAGLGLAVEAGAELRLDGPLIVLRGGAVLVSAVRLQERLSFASPGFSPLYGSPAQGVAFRSASAASVETLAGRVEAFAVLDGSAAGLSASGGHRIALHGLTPASWPVGLGFTDAFSTSGPAGAVTTSHETDLSLTVLKRASVLAGTVARVEAGVLEQSWRAAIAWSPAASFGLGLSGRASKRASGYASSGDWYLPLWADGFRFIGPWTGGIDDWRRGSLKAELSALVRPVGLTLAGETGFSSSGMVSGRRRQDTILGYTLSVPVKLRPAGGPELTVSAAYKQSVGLSTLEAEEGGGFGTDLSAAGAVLAHHAWMLAWVPGVDVVSPRALEAIEGRLDDANDYPLVGARWEPSLTLALSRGAGSRLLDLVVPAFLDVGFVRRARLEGDLTEGSTSLSAAMRTTALNLFGRTGAFPLFSFYDSDELTGTARVELGVPLHGAALPTADLSLSSFVSLASKPRFGVLIENRLRIRWGPDAGAADQGTVQVSWVGLQGLPLPSLLTGSLWRKAVRSATGELRHVERIELDVRTPFGAAGSGMAVRLRHVSVLEYPGLGSVRAHAALGADLVNDTGAWMPGVGIEAGIDVELRF